MKQGDKIYIHNHPLTTEGKVYTVLYSTMRAPTSNDRKYQMVEWVAYENDKGVTNFVKSDQCSIVKDSKVIEEQTPVKPVYVETHLEAMQETVHETSSIKTSKYKKVKYK